MAVRRRIAVKAAIFVLVLSTLSACSGRGISDGCGNDVSDVQSIVLGIDASSGAVRWRTSVPATVVVVTEDPGHVRAIAQWQHHDTIIDATNGEIFATPSRTTPPMVTIVAYPNTEHPFGAMVWNDQIVSASVDVGTTKVMSNVWDRREMDRPLTVRAEDPEFAVLWSLELDPVRSRTSGVPRFVTFGDMVITSYVLDAPEACDRS